MIRYLLIAAALLLCVARSLAHGDWPAKHGGLINEGGETTFELVVQRNKWVVYLEDHGEALPTAGASGTLKVTRGAAQGSTPAAVTPLKAAGGNRLEGPAPGKLVAGDKLMARVTLGNGSVVVGRFTVAGQSR
jgi:hypothetical protein